MLHDAARAAGATPIDGRFQHFGPGLGVTSVPLFKESRISIHTWPECGFAATDIFMCGAARPELGIDMIVAAFQPADTSVRDTACGPAAAESAWLVYTAG